MNATSALITGDGSVRSSHVSPRSAERNSRCPPTRAHTTVPDGALSCANDGSGIGVGDAVDELVGFGVGLGADERGDGLGDVAAPGWFEHAVRKKTRTKSFRIADSVASRVAQDI